MTYVRIREQMPNNIFEKVSPYLADDENIIISIKGSLSEWLICTDKKVHIVKSGFLSNRPFTSSISTIPYSQITNVRLSTFLCYGTFELFTASSTENITIFSFQKKQKFEEACAIVTQQISEEKMNDIFG